LIEELQGKIAQLETAQAELVGKERLERELELARRCSRTSCPGYFLICPASPLLPATIFARQVGGFYDVITLDQDHFGLIIADVSDKGMPAALYMALTRSLLLAEALPYLAFGGLDECQPPLLELGQSQQFVSVFYGVANRQTLHLVYARRA
jgi:serine phosphatase RsbU (regulator of sigma subunit)